MVSSKINGMVRKSLTWALLKHKKVGYFPLDCCLISSSLMHQQDSFLPEFNEGSLTICCNKTGCIIERK